jgi:predicted RNA-binding protein with PIN domain
VILFLTMTPSTSRKPGRTRKHDHFRVTVTYTDNEQSAKVFTDREKAEKFAARQEKSPVVKSAQIVKLD